MSPEDATWEEVTCLAQQFPDFDLEDKDRVLGGAIDGDPIRKSRIRLLILNIRNNPISRIRIRDRRKTCLNFLVIWLGYLSLSLFELSRVLALSLFEL
jgi:hypothetical protein